MVKSHLDYYEEYFIRSSQDETNLMKNLIIKNHRKEKYEESDKELDKSIRGDVSSKGKHLLTFELPYPLSANTSPRFNKTKHS